MKKQQGAFMTNLILVVLLAAVLVYLGFYAVSALNDPFQTTPAVEYTAEETLTLVGWVVRDETVVTAQAAYIDVRVEEGEKVAAGQVLARTYGSEEELERQRRMDELELSLAQLEQVFTADSDPAAAAKLDQQINQTVLALSAAAADGDLSHVENQVLALKSLVLSRSEIFSGSGDVAALRRTLQSELDSLSRSAGTTGVIYAEQSALFSSQTDGYEGLLNADMLADFQPSDFDALERSEPADTEDAVGKYINGIRWYLVTLVEQEDAAVISGASSLSMRFAGGYTDALSMDVERLGQPDAQGRCVLVLSCDRSMTDTIFLRRQSVDIIGEQYSGIRIPRKALRVSEEGKTGVYCVSGAQARFKEVKIIYELDNYFIVRRDPENPSALHPGDEIIVNAKGLYDGKVLE